MKPNAADYNPDPKYLAELIGSLPHTQPELGALLGVDPRTIRRWLSGARQFPYTVQFAIESLVLEP